MVFVMRRLTDVAQNCSHSDALHKTLLCRSQLFRAFVLANSRRSSSALRPHPVSRLPNPVPMPSHGIVSSKPSATLSASA